MTELKTLYVYHGYTGKFELFEIVKNLKNHWVLKDGRKVKKSNGKAEGFANGLTFKPYDTDAELLLKKVSDLQEFKRCMGIFLHKIGKLSFADARKVDTDELLDHCRKISSLIEG